MQCSYPQCFQCGSGSSILGQCGSGPGSIQGFDDEKLKNTYTAEKKFNSFLFLIKHECRFCLQYISHRGDSHKWRQTHEGLRIW
jgi:hypothetical protein